MKPRASISSALLVAAALLIAQTAEPQVTNGTRKGPPRNPEQSPASQPRPQTKTAQAYPAELVKAGEAKFNSQCGFCHGRDAAGGETGPDLTRSELVAGDDHGDRIAPVVRAGRTEQGMPSFSSLSEADLAAIVAFIHDRKNLADRENGGRRSVAPADIAGNAADGRSYFYAAGGCSRCHAVDGDLKGIASRYQGLALLQRMLYPGGRPAPAPPKATFTLPLGQTLVAPVAAEDEFSITILDPLGKRQTYDKAAVKFQIDNPLSAHFDQLAKYTDDAMHNVYAYLETLK